MLPDIASHRLRSPGLPWIGVSGSYFVEANGRAWTPIGQNDAIGWPDLRGLFRRHDVAFVEGHLRWLAEHGVTCLRLMLEYSDGYGHYLERPPGRFVPAMVQFWDDLIVLCERFGLRILLTPFDTFWHWNRWDSHPYNVKKGGMLDNATRFLVSPEARAAIKRRFDFAIRRWGWSGAIFAWDLWNEIHPAQAEESADGFTEFIHDLSDHVRALETSIYGRARPQTVSLFGPELRWRAHMKMEHSIFRHPDLDFATIHIYEEGTIDDPHDTVAPAKGMARIVRKALAETPDRRPFLDTEHGPIHAFKDRKLTLSEPFDDEYFRHMQWAHLAAGGAGGGMRWPNRHPHVLTHGMRRAQKGMADFLPLIDWTRFSRSNLNEEVRAEGADVTVAACGDAEQAVVWLLRDDIVSRRPRSTVRTAVKPVAPAITIPGLADGTYRVTAWNTSKGEPAGAFAAQAEAGALSFRSPPFSADLAFAVQVQR